MAHLITYSLMSHFRNSARFKRLVPYKRDFQVYEHNKFDRDEFWQCTLKYILLLHIGNLKQKSTFDVIEIKKFTSKTRLVFTVGIRFLSKEKNGLAENLILTKIVSFSFFLENIWWGKSLSFWIIFSFSAKFKTWCLCFGSRCHIVHFFSILSQLFNLVRRYGFQNNGFLKFMVYKTLWFNHQK